MRAKIFDLFFNSKHGLAMRGVCIALVLTFVFCANLTANAGNGISGGVRFHKDHSRFEDLPYDKDDMSYFLMYELGNEHAAWLLGVDYAPDVSGFYGAEADEESPDAMRADYVVTPQLSLILKDRIFRAGTGIMASYVKTEDNGHEWLFPYWQMELGLEFQLGKNLAAGASAYYLLDKWSDISKFRTDEIEYGVKMSYFF